MTKNKWFLNGSRGSGRTIRLLCEPYENKIADFKKENAELKEKNKSYEELIDNSSITLVKERLKNYKQLTKAKEIIREFVEWANWQGNSKCPSFKSIQDKAEQFLNSEVENEKD